MLRSIRQITASLLLCGLAGCTASKGDWPPQLAYCAQLHNLYFRYHTIITYGHDGQRARAEIALDDCAHGDYAAGIEMLVALLIQNRVPVPPPPPSGGGT